MLNFQNNNGDSPFEEVDLNDILTNIIFDRQLTIAEKHAVIHYKKLPVIQAISLQIN